MPSLKDLKNRIYSVKSTRKITSAMKMVAASKLRKAQDHAEAARPYAGRMAGVVSDLMQQVDLTKLSLPLLQGNGKDQTILLVLMTSDRGLCGAFNSSIVREARHRVRDLEAQGKTVKLICVGRKARDMLRREYGDKFLHTVESGAKRNIDFADAQDLANRIVGFFEDGSFDVGYVIYNKFRSAISQIVTVQQIVPFVPPHVEKAPETGKGPQALHELYEPAKEALLTEILPRNLATALFSALLESSAGEQGARMTAMDNATRNAGDMIDRLTLNYNRSRQAYITNELIEIISGAEAV